MNRIQTFQQAIGYIHARPRLRLEGDEASSRAAAFLHRLGNPGRGLRLVHITGTNGKGSAAAMLSSMLTASGCRTGLFISPYVLEFRERIQIDHEMIPKKALVRLVEQAAGAVEEMDREGTPVNEFILDFGLAMLWFEQQGCSAAVIEAGIGGRHDATCCLPPPALSVIMGIGLDHTAVLGDTPAEIAKDKSAIIKGNPTLLYPEQPPEAMAVVMERCAETGSELVIPSLREAEIQSESLSGTVFRYGGQDYALPLLGRYQVKNAVTAITGGKMLGLDEQTIQKGIAQVSFPCRLELVRTAPPVIIDGAHNLHGMNALKESLPPLLGDRRPVLLVGMLRDKDFSDALSAVAPLAEKIITVAVDNPRTTSAQETAAAARTGCEDVRAVDNWREGLSQALELAQNEERALVICGSLYLAADCRAWLHETK